MGSSAFYHFPWMCSQLLPPSSYLTNTANLCPRRDMDAVVGRLRVTWWHLRMEGPRVMAPCR